MLKEPRVFVKSTSAEFVHFSAEATPTMQKSSAEEDEWLPRDEVCDLLHITPTTL